METKTEHPPDILPLDFRGRRYLINTLHRFPQDPSWFSFYDESNVRDRDWTVKEGDLVLDVGSAYGSYAMTALVSGAAKVICFNPNGEENTVLGQNARINGWDSRLEIHEHGLYSKEGLVDDACTRFEPRPVPRKGYFSVHTLDSVLGASGLEMLKYPSIWLKLDVEGAELEVLKGARNFLESHSNIKILVENHVFKIPSIENDVREFLTYMDYVHVSTHPHHGVTHSVYVGREAFLAEARARHPKLWD